MSKAMQGVLEPKPNYFLALGWFNEVVATRDIRDITDRRLFDRLKDAQPICHSNGTPYTAPDFFALYTGLIDPPEEFGADQITQEDVDYWQGELRLAFREIVMDEMRPPKEVWADIAKGCEGEGMNPDEISWCQEVVAGLRDATVEEALRQRQKHPSMPLITAMLKVAGGTQDRLGKLQNWLRPFAKQAPPAVWPQVEGHQKSRRRMGFEASYASVHKTVAVGELEQYTAGALSFINGTRPGQPDTGVVIDHL